MKLEEMQAPSAPEIFSALVATPNEGSEEDFGPSFITYCGKPRSADD